MKFRPLKSTTSVLSGTGAESRQAEESFGSRPKLKVAFGRRHWAVRCKSAAQSLETIQLKDGTRFSPIINGTWQLAGGHGRAVFDHIFERLEPLAESGFTTYDTADIYGASEEILGQLQSRWRANGKEPLQMFTKYVPHPKMGSPSRAAIKDAVNRSRRSLQMQQLDLVQLHWGDYSLPGMLDTMLVLCELQSIGMIRSLGVTNMDTRHLEMLTDNDIPIVSNQVQLSLMDRRPLGPNGMVQLCKERGLKLFAYGAVAGGLLTNRYLERNTNPLYGNFRYRYVDLDTVSLKMYWNVVRLFGGEATWRLLLEVLREVAEKHGTSIACVAIQWAMSQGGGGVVYPIIGVRNTKHIQSNAAALDLRLDDDDFEHIEEQLRKSQPLAGDIYSFERSQF